LDTANYDVAIDISGAGEQIRRKLMECRDENGTPLSAQP